jgi:hypothetical protein
MSDPSYDSAAHARRVMEAFRAGEAEAAAKRGPPPEFSHEFAENLLVAAAWDGNVHMADVLLAFIKASQPCLDYALARAAEGGHTHIVESLLRRGAKTSENNYYGLRQAARHGYTETVKLLLEHGAGADVAAVGNLAVKDAASGDHFETVRVLLDHGAVLERPIPRECGPDHEGLSRGMADVLRTYGDRGVDLRKPGQWPMPAVRKF